MGIFGRTTPKPPVGSALERASAHEAAGPDDGLSARVAEFVERLLEVGIDGRGPFDSAQQVAASALDKEGSREAAISALTRTHVGLAAAGGFVTGLGGFLTLPVALPVNVLEFYVLATRAVAATAHLRGYDLARPEVRSAVLLTLAGADTEDILKKAGLAGSGRITRLAGQRLPASAIMVINKGVGFRLVTQAGKGVFARFGRAVPVLGGGIGAGLDGFLMARIVSAARAEFPLHLAADAATD